MSESLILPTLGLIILITFILALNASVFLFLHYKLIYLILGFIIASLYILSEYLASTSKNLKRKYKPAGAIFNAAAITLGFTLPIMVIFIFGSAFCLHFTLTPNE
jgi:4-amino-4-deoxy-L-arabinose transferase-like glycosyltransferase